MRIVAKTSPTGQ
jgi:hypothetical protein